MTVHDRIRLTGQLPEGPAQAGSSHFGRPGGLALPPCPRPSTPASRAPGSSGSAGERRELVRDEVAIEEPLEIRVDGRALAVTMRTPGADEELAVGFLLGEGLIAGRDDVADVGPQRRAGGQHRRGRHARGAAARPVRRAPVPHDLLLRRVRQGRAGAGAPGGARAARRRPVRIEPAQVLDLPGRARPAQDAFDRTGGHPRHGAVHRRRASCWCCARTSGATTRWTRPSARWCWAGATAAGALACLSGRIGFELVQKAVMGGLSGIVAVGAPTSLAVELAQEHGLLVCGFVRDGTLQRVLRRRAGRRGAARLEGYGRRLRGIVSRAHGAPRLPHPVRAAGRGRRLHRLLRWPGQGPRGLPDPRRRGVQGLRHGRLRGPGRRRPRAGAGQPRRGRGRHGRAALGAPDRARSPTASRCSASAAPAATRWARSTPAASPARTWTAIGEVTPARIKTAIRVGGTGQGQMPAGLLSGPDADDVAEYLAEGRRPQLAPGPRDTPHLAANGACAGIFSRRRRLLQCPPFTPRPHPGRGGTKGREARGERPETAKGSSFSPSPTANPAGIRKESTCPKPPVPASCGKKIPTNRPSPPSPYERRTVKITGQPVPARRRPSPTASRIQARPDRIVLWAFLLRAVPGLHGRRHRLRLSLQLALRRAAYPRRIP